MQKTYLKYLKYLKNPNNVIIFIIGLLTGSILTYIAIHLPRDIKTSKQHSNIAIVKPAFDPFEKFDIPLNNRIKTKIQYFRP